ncbi:hypothetical protein OAB29_03005 [Oceanospirillaceae bacterium]|nr:hypothetical protein [Oceanospirillaceae bacterium]
MFTYTEHTNNAPLINVVDALMGQGKSTWLINTVNQLMASIFDDVTPPNIIIVTPYLEEVKRFQKQCPVADFVSPVAHGQSKTDNFHELLEAGHNIVTTHALWKGLNRTTYELVSKHKYVLYIDEMMECVEHCKEFSNSDFKMLFNHKLISIADDGRILWNHDNEPNYRGKFDHLKSLCENGNLFRYKDKMNFWIFPTDFLEQFSEVWVLTYLWSGSIMDAYVLAAGYRVHHHTLVDYHLEPYSLIDEGPMRARIKSLITIIDDPKLNVIGNTSKYGSEPRPLSSSWYGRQDAGVLHKIHNLIYNYYKNKVSGGASQAMWTCYAPQRITLKGSGFAKGHIACNARATNEHRHRTNLAYMIDLYMVPIVKTFIESRGVKVSQDQYSLSALVQWIFRSAIRDAKPINLFIPSQRMRGLLMDWLNPERMGL